MKIIIKKADENKLIKVPIPLPLLLNPATAAIGSACTEYSYNQLNQIITVLRKSKKVLNGMPFIEIVEKNGDHIVIYL